MGAANTSRRPLDSDDSKISYFYIQCACITRTVNVLRFVDLKVGQNSPFIRSVSGAVHILTKMF
jgi:hypothetical protein